QVRKSVSYAPRTPCAPGTWSLDPAGEGSPPASAPECPAGPLPVRVSGSWILQCGLSRCTEAVIPGRNEPRSPVNVTSTSNVPLEGSTTGLTCFTLAGCFSPGASAQVTSTCWPVCILPKNFSGSVNRISNGASAVTQK